MEGKSCGATRAFGERTGGVSDDFGRACPGRRRRLRGNVRLQMSGVGRLEEPCWLSDVQSGACCGAAGGMGNKGHHWPAGGWEVSAVDIAAGRARTMRSRSPQAQTVSRRESSLERWGIMCGGLRISRASSAARRSF